MSLSCKLCLKRIELPTIVLPCKEIEEYEEKTICFKHLKELLTNENSNVIYCPVCKEDHLIPTGGFKQNKYMENLANSFPLTDKQQEAYLIMEKHEPLIKSTLKINNDASLFIHEYCFNKKREIQIKAEECIKRIEKFEDECQKEIKINDSITNELKNYTQLIKTFEAKFKQWNKELTDLNSKLNDNYWLSMLKECEGFDKESIKKQDSLENALLKKKIFFFLNETIESFGELHIET
jgi:hypothetical protein